ncbi:type IX secretion system plug protein [Pedobacter insulae]|uniref:Type 9 secretion system plug protein N-terminal domain-containing protein n=1 Tax=Pedobacter insulae TaxID=414048 RepID=A0A1I2WMH6_9SPHI|nr:DUF5103 domain-containing protein [Pedobacter insulae]SFH01827.1 protein of unknown function [Pedobacter insulae]
MKKAIFLSIWLSCTLHSWAQEAFVYENKVYQSSIKTVECYNSKKEQSIPIYTLKSNESLTFSFDDLKGGNRGFSYTVEHCSADWKPSKINYIDYLESFNEDIITKYRYSFNTLQKFTHYDLKLPNDQIRPKIAGNYLLKVYENGNKNKPVISQRFFVLDPVLNVGTEIVASSQVVNRTKKQKVNFTIFHQMPIQNPHQDIKAIVMQNMNTHTAILNTKPLFVKQGSLVYNELNANEFWGGNEFRKFDIRSFRFKAEHVQEIYVDTINVAQLFTDVSGSAPKYTNQFDENGNFFIRNQDGRDSATDSDYTKVIFSLSTTPPNSKGNIYVVGRFNNFNLSEENKLVYDISKRKYFANIKLKQGLYDYKYIWVDETGKFDDTYFEGSFFETDNSYQVFVYYRKPGGRWEELIGFSHVNSAIK